MFVIRPSASAIVRLLASTRSPPRWWRVVTLVINETDAAKCERRPVDETTQRFLQQLKAIGTVVYVTIGSGPGNAIRPSVRLRLTARVGANCAPLREPQVSPTPYQLLAFPPTRKRVKLSVWSLNR
jgi:hypothetical protein